LARYVNPVRLEKSPDVVTGGEENDPIEEKDVAFPE
jgi:hypothetical protein